MIPSFILKLKNANQQEWLNRNTFLHTYPEIRLYFRFALYKAKRKESLIQTFYETSAAHFFD